MKKFFTILLVIAAATMFLTADTFIKQKTHTDAFNMMGKDQPAKDSFSEIWLGDNMFAQHQEEQSLIFDLGKNKLFMVNHKDKSYIEADLPLDFSKLLPPEAAQMMSMMKLTNFTVTPNGQTKTVGKWKCTGYDMEMVMGFMTMKQVIWASSDVPFDWKKFSENIYPKVINATAARGMLGEDGIKKLKSIAGYPVASDVTVQVMGKDIKSNTMVVEISEKAAPAGTYAPPSDYAKKEKLSLPGMGG